MNDGLITFSAADIHAALSYDACIPAVRQAMIDHSAGITRHLLRSFISLGEGRTFAQMPAALATHGYFGAKLVSVFADPDDPGHRSHRGVVVLFEGQHGEPVCVADGGAVTLIRTAAASAVATDVLARADARTLAVLGTGHQAEAHVHALSRVRPFERVIIWGRNPKRAEDLARRLADGTGLAVETAAAVRHAVAEADVVCTVTSAREPILEGAWLPEGVHVNVVGSSAPGPAEVDHDVVTRSRFIADCREHVSQHGAEFLRAKQAGLVSDDHIAAEIGEVLAGTKEGRQSDAQITVYKSLGHAVQDLAALAWVYEHAGRRQAAG